MAGMTADAVYVLLGDEIVLLTEKVEQMGGWEPLEHKGTVQTAEDLPTDAKKGWMYNIATDSIYGAAGMNVVMTSEGWDSMGPIINMGLYLTKEEGNKAFQPKGNYLSGTDSDLKESGKAADAKATGEKIAKNSSDITKKLDKNQGVENSGKIAGINESGDIVPMFPMDVDYNSETNCLEFGSDQKMKLNQGIGLDNTLTKSGSAADAGVTGKKIASLKEELTSKADKTALVKTDRKLDALWKLNQGINYEFQTDDAEAYQKMVQSGAKVASIKSIGGKTIVWNQLLGTGYEDTKTANGITFTNNGDGSITIDGTAATDATFQINKNKSFVLCSDHKYLWNVGAIVNGVSIGNNNYTKFYKRDISAWNATLGKYNGYNCIKVANGTTVSNLTIRPRLFDLTLMFGLGNEPSTPEEFEDMFPADYYPHNAGELMSVPVNEVMEQGKNLFDQNVEESSSITEYKPYRKTSHTIPSVVLELDGYGDGIDNVCNYVDWENKKYHKRIGRYVVTGDEQFYSNQTYIGDNSSNAYMDMDIGQKQSTDAKLISNKLLYSKWCWSEDRTYDAICLNNTQIHIRISNSSLGITNEASPVETQNATKKYCKNLHESGDPIIIYYELAEEEIIDISDIIGDTFQKPLEVESGGTLMFRNTNGDDYRIPVPNTEEYLVSLAEVAK